MSVLDQAALNLPWIKDRTIFLTVHGSKAYGTNVATSDTDYKGVAIPPKNYYLGSQHHFEQAELKDPDTTIFELKKFLNLASNANPNVIEVLFTDPSDHVLVSPAGQILLDNKEKFLSKRIRFTFGGYARSQLKRIDLHRRWLLHPAKSPPSRKELGLPEQTLIPQDKMLAVKAEIKKEMDKFQFDFMEDLSEPNKIMIRGVMEDMLAELKITADDQWLSAARKIGLDDNFIYLMQKEREYSEKKREFDQYQNWIATRNKKRAADEEKFGLDLKHAYHLIRLMRMCKEILATGEVLVKRPDREELLEIRSGKYTYDELMVQVNKENQEIEKLFNTSNVLPDKPNVNFIDDMCIKMIEKSFS
jgi:predicted nucleotidyltransferase